VDITSHELKQVIKRRVQDPLENTDAWVSFNHSTLLIWQTSTATSVW